ncbi:Aldehyde dehydrogenase protein [Pseudomonas syringae pv. helianthi]|nr:Aldehyde dehydrogenase protein [Pseudomonas syringae pv. helianthi]
MQQEEDMQMTTLTRADWEQRAQNLKVEGRAFIQGEYTAAASGETFDCVSPVDGRLLVKVASCDAADAQRAVDSARSAFDSGAWSRLAPARRKETMIRFAGLLKQNAEELALLETLDMGKPISDSLGVDIPGAARALSWSGEAIDKLYDEVAATPHDQLGLVTREPVGVVAAIVPWNFPLMMACWKLGPALSTGNSVILKPSEKSPLTAIRIAQLAIEAGIPAGVLNVLPGYGHTVGKALALHMDVDTVVFTGSSKIARQLMIYAGESNMKRVWLEAGGKSPNIVFADAPDLQAAADAAASAIAFNQGEVCTAGSRLLIERSIKDRFLPMVIEALATWKPGNPLDPATNVGALVDTQQMNTVLSYIEAGHADGARLVAGGKRVLQDTGGTYVEPTIFDGVNNAMKIAQEEIFGPVLSVLTFDSAEEAIQIANDSPYGLAAAVWTANISRAHLTARALRAGSVWVNQYDGGDMTAPFGGFKQSGNGRDKSLHAFDKYTELKSTWIKL